MLPPGLPILRLPRGIPEAGCLLVATPMLTEEEFARTVVLLLDHDDDGSLGVILNRVGDLEVNDVLPTWAAAVEQKVAWPLLFDGGPVAEDTAVGVAALHPGRFGAFGARSRILDDPDSVIARDLVDGGALRPVGSGLWSEWALVDLDADAAVVASQVAAIGIFAGYAGWSAGQLQAEIDEGAWYVVGSSARDLTQSRTDDVWARVLRRQRSELAFVAGLPAEPERN